MNQFDLQHLTYNTLLTFSRRLYPSLNLLRDIYYREEPPTTRVLYKQLRSYNESI